MSNEGEQGLVTTIIPVYNRPLVVLEAVDSVLAQTYRPIEIILVDDGSTDSTPEVIDALAERHPEEIFAIHIENGGAGLAREAGRKRARGEFIQYLDSDDKLLLNKFEMQVAALREHPECGIAYGYTRLIDANNQVLDAPYKRTGEDISTLFPLLLMERWWNTHTPLFRRSVCDAIGPWSDMRMSEDWQYDARAGALGVKLIHCPEYLSDTRRHEDDRLTGKQLSPATIKDLGRLIATLYDCALQVGIPGNSPEMQKFSRWAFLMARLAGAAGLADTARKCFAIAVQAAQGANTYTKDLKIYPLVVSAIGWRLAGRLSCVLDNILNNTIRIKKH